MYSIKMKDPFEHFLGQHAVKGKEKPITHTRIGAVNEGLFPGKYHIPPEDMNEFNSLYCTKVFGERRNEYLTEVQQKTGPLLIDLDFRYEPEITERQHTIDHIMDLIELYAETLSKILDLDGQKINVYVLEKENVNCQDGVTKDGIHMIIDVGVDPGMRVLIREQILEGIEDVFNELPLQNTYDDVVDRGVSHGYTNWQMYGSRKPGNEAYEIKSCFELEFEEESIGINEIDKPSHQRIIKNVSARANKALATVRQAWQDKHESAKNRVKGKSSGQKKLQVNAASKHRAFTETGIDVKDNNISAGKNLKETVKHIEEQVEQLLDSLPPTEYYIKEAHDYTMCLSSRFYDDRNKWLEVGWALNNTSKRLLPSWLLFSSKSEKFTLDELENCKREWHAASHRSDDACKLTERSIMFWAKQDNPDEYAKVRKDSIDYWMEQSLQGATEYDIAYVLHMLFKDQYRCASIKHKAWYQFKNHRWNYIDSGCNLRLKISSHLSPLYNAKVAALCDAMLAVEEGSDAFQGLKEKSKKYSNIAIMLKKTIFKNNVMRECCELFYEPHFIDRLDKNPYLLCFKNGVVDFKQKCFRNGEADDYLSKCTNTNFVANILQTEEGKENAKEIKDFISKLFTNPELEKYMWEHLASTMIGTNENQVFNLYTGVGSNGKSKLVELMEKVMGEYKGTVPISLVTTKRQTIGSCSPEIANLQGVRYAVMQEPSKGDKLNEGIMKELTGGDPIQGRALYQDSVTFIPQFSLVVCTNTLFNVSSNDGGTWRRMGVVDFTSRFVDNPNPDKNEFEKDKKIGEKFERWVPTLSAMLVELAYKNQGVVEMCEAVKVASHKYRCSQDHIAEFVDEFIVEDPDGMIKKREIWIEFKNWYSSVYGMRGQPGPKDLQSYLIKTLGPIDESDNSWKGFKYNYDA